MSPESDFEWPDLCLVGIMSISEGGADKGDNIEGTDPWTRPAS